MSRVVTDETRKKISDKLKGKNHPFYGKTLSKEHKEKICQALLGHKQSDEMKEKISKLHKGKIVSEKTKEKIRKNHSKYWLGKKFPDEVRLKMGNSHRQEKNGMWRGGLTEIVYPPEWTNVLKESIRLRDNYLCQITECQIKQEDLDCGRIKKLDVHHIDYDKHNCNPDNLISLCHNCHLKTNVNREYWIKYFKLKI